MTPTAVSAPAKRAAAKKAPKTLGALPEWNLADLYPSMDAPTVKADLDKGETQCIEFEKDYKSRLEAMATGPEAGKALAEAVRRYEAIEDVLGRLISYAGLLYSGNSTDPTIAKFYGDMQERITAASLHLLFFQLELNRLEDSVLEAAMADQALGHYRPWIEDIRKDKPYQLDDRIEQLFHEKSVTGYSAFNRLFDETMVALRFKVGGKLLTQEQTLNLMQDPENRHFHTAFELRDWGHMLTACDTLSLAGYKLLWGPGRHGIGHNLFTYHRGPNGLITELFAQLDQMNEEMGYFEPRPWHRDRPQSPKVWSKDPNAANYWGIMPVMPEDQMHK